MNDPKRFLDGGGTDLEQMLLASGRAARPSARARWKTEALVLLAGLGVVAKAKAASPLGSKAYAWVLMRYLAFGIVGAAAAWGAGHVLLRPSHGTPEVELAAAAKPVAPTTAFESPSAETSMPATAALEVAPSETVLPRGTEPANERAPRAAHGAASARAPAPSSSIGSEVQELDRARFALADAQPKTAIVLLDRYAQAFPKGVLQQEALRLRIEALVALGDRSTARSLLSRFQTLYPNSPHAKRLHSIVNP